jgi:predicted acylesterase/phospholipase RssA
MLVRVLVAVTVAVSLALSGCAGTRLLAPPAESKDELATLRGMDPELEIRFWGDRAPERMHEQLRELGEQIAARIAAEGELPNDGSYDVLALSGGGSDGAYGAGLLNGWSERGDRPEFAVVTGISVGALLAPFAFLGEDYDDEVEELFTETSTEEVVDVIPIRALFGWALGLADLTPLELTFERILTPEMVARIAEEHLKGRRLWIGTTFLDAQRPVIWDIGAIAASDYEDKRDLIQEVLLASAAVPGAFPPVLFRVRLNGRFYSEMHVDGAITQSLFVYPHNLDLREQVSSDANGMRIGTIYLVRNTKLEPEFQPVPPSLLSIAERSIWTLMKSAGIGDIMAIENLARRDGWVLQRTAVPLEFDAVGGDFFDPDYMRALYEVGFERALNGTAFETVVGPGA